MISQKQQPMRWIVIDDGSSDATGAILDKAAKEHRWIEPHHLPRGRERAPGGESLIMQFLPPETTTYDHLLRVDADVSFDSDLVEALLMEFVRDPALGIAGPVLLEPSRSGWHEVRAPRFHVPGPLKMYSQKCFAAIGGLEPGLGWDTIDETTALMLGFATRSFPDIRAFHHRRQGAASGALRNRVAQGLAAYNAGYSPAFMIARAGWNVFEDPPIFSSAAMLAGYCQGFLKRSSRPAPPALVKFVRRQQRRRLLMMESVWR
jgi:poly-beta-1,6-N-acetyl-D-glucosamine synthase